MPVLNYFAGHRCRAGRGRVLCRADSQSNPSSNSDWRAFRNTLVKKEVSENKACVGKSRTLHVSTAFAMYLEINEIHGCRVTLAKEDPGTCMLRRFCYFGDEIGL